MNITAPSDHPRPDELEAYGLGKLQGDEASQVESHLSTCVDCSQTLKEQSGDSFIDMVRAAQVLEEPSASFPTANSAFAAAKTYDPGAQTEAGFLEEHGQQSKKTFQIVPELVNHPRYRIRALLGQGGMGAVYLAEHRLMERRVALKTIGKDLSARPNLVERFHLEVKAAARLSHPNIVSAYDAEQAGGMHFLVMEYVEGTDLAALVAKRGPLPVEQACEYIRQAALGLQHAHEQGMIHRDIKPHNLMVTPAGQVKILDFGLARFAREAENQSGAVTALGAIMGTPDYMAPEQANDSHLADIRADIYSLGCTLYFLLAGCVPFPKGSFMDKMMRHTQVQPPPLTQFRSDIVAGLAEIVAKMMAKKPARRFQTPLEVAKALEQFIPSKGIRQLPPRDPAAELFALVLATDDEIVSTSRSLGKKGNTDFRRRRRTGIEALIALVGLLALFVGGGVCLYQVIIHVETPQGMLEIRTDDDNVEVKVLQGGKEVMIIDQTTGMKLNLKEGDYDLKLVSDRNDLKLSKDHIAVKRDDKVIVQVSRTIPPKSNHTAGKDPNPLEQKLAPELVYRFEWPGAHCGAILSPDNRYCLGQSDLLTSRIWDMANGKLIAETPLIYGTFTADAKQIVGHQAKSTVFVWDVLNSKESRKWDVPEAVSDLALSPDITRRLSVPQT